ncbi:STAS domain-containing protein [Desulfotomaculum sp. 1211_IL3151]|uniref:STAS domain-containing protein n=1 Tax=Desulfotomaculum sp. 1211_IL3151 TaxID=3084055 RepID=UPI002FDB0863
MINESISVIKIRDILLVTMPPDPDDHSITVLQDKILNTMQRYQVKGLILDISSIKTMDSFLARVVVETAQMVVLMGGKTVIAGMQPSVAITATQLGLTLGGALTALNVDLALEMVSDNFKRGL